MDESSQRHTPEPNPETAHDVYTPGGRRLTVHAAQHSLDRHGFQPPYAEIDYIIDDNSFVTTQADGAIVYIQVVKKADANTICS
ncbi:MAG: hypothetical protein HC876_10210 [Chloroflexaceae bacterium]|nr:hypothetical protein [Chloroflexaceae bacterium]NJO05855.1 hypothetical protein [Chloroflexaceae bacterium]